VRQALARVELWFGEQTESVLKNEPPRRNTAPVETKLREVDACGIASSLPADSIAARGELALVGTLDHSSLDVEDDDLNVRVPRKFELERHRAPRRVRTGVAELDPPGPRTIIVQRPLHGHRD
jgi:hypothetical protein